MKYDSHRARELLKSGTGRSDAAFREGQEEAIRHLMEGRGRLLVVQKTGWGKSVVYFIAAKLLREAGEGPALLVSPLLALMRNQIAAAERMGIHAIRIASDNQDDWKVGEEALRCGKADILLISPERLGNERFRTEVLAELPNASACWSLTKPTASRIGDTISGPTTGGSNGPPATFRRTSAFSPPPRPQTIG